MQQTRRLRRLDTQSAESVGDEIQPTFLLLLRLRDGLESKVCSATIFSSVGGLLRLASRAGQASIRGLVVDFLFRRVKQAPQRCAPKHRGL